MKTKKLLALILSVLTIVSCTSIAFAAQSFSGTVSGDITIQSGATIGDDAVFSGSVTIASNATVSKGTFNGTVSNSGTISGGLFKNAVTNNGTINGGTFKSNVTNNTAGNFLSCGINAGTFDGSVTNANNATIGGGTFNGSVTNNGEIKASLYSLAAALVINGTVTNNSKISNGSYYGTVNNSGTISGGLYYNVINNSGTVKNVSAIIKNGNGYTVSGSPTICSTVTLSGKDTTFVLDKGSYITVSEGGQINLNCSCTINGTITLSNGGKLTSNGGSLTNGSAGTILVPMDSSFSGTTASKFDYITYKEYAITVESNVDKSQFDFSIASSAYKGNTVSYVLDLSATYNGCITINSITVYNGKKNDSNIIKRTSDKTGNFTMPDNKVIVYVDCTANHSATSEHKDPTCTASGYDKTYCSVCKHELTYKKIDALGHQYNGWIRNTDPDTKLIKSRTCTRANCGYTEKSYIEIKGYDNQTVTVDYKSTLTFHYYVSAPDGCYIQWIKDNNSAVAANENGYKVEQATSDFTITARVYGAVTDEYKVTVKVNKGFFDKVKAFFRGLFGSLPVYIDNVKQ